MVEKVRIRDLKSMSSVPVLFDSPVFKIPQSAASAIDLYPGSSEVHDVSELAWVEHDGVVAY